MIPKDYCFCSSSHDSTPVDSGFDDSEESTSNTNPTSEDLSGLYIPDFLGEANDGE